MKRYLIPTLIIIFVVSSAVGCINTSADYEQRIADLEQKVATLSAEVNTLRTKPQPRVIEEDIEVNYSKGRFPFYLKAGDRVEGEVSITHSAIVMVGVVINPYGNRVVQTSHMSTGGEFSRNSGFPWRFAFVASIDGEYELSISHTSTTSTIMEKGLPLAHVKIVCNMND